MIVCLLFFFTSLLNPITSLFQPDFDVISSGNSKGSQRRQLKSFDELKEQWKRLADESIDKNRPSEAAKAIAHAAGIYRDVSKAKRFKTESTVLVNVVSFQNDDHHIKYQHLLRNWFCYASHLGLRPLTYIVPSPNISFSTQVDELHAIGVFGEFISYPKELFWSLVAEKEYMAGSGGGKVDYEGIVPSFAHFGALVMLVPILEVLYHVYTYNVD